MKQTGFDIVVGHAMRMKIVDTRQKSGKVASGLGFGYVSFDTLSSAHCLSAIAIARYMRTHSASACCESAWVISEKSVTEGENALTSIVTSASVEERRIMFGQSINVQIR